MGFPPYTLPKGVRSLERYTGRLSPLSAPSIFRRLFGYSVHFVFGFLGPLAFAFCYLGLAFWAARSVSDGSPDLSTLLSAPGTVSPFPLQGRCCRGAPRPSTGEGCWVGPSPTDGVLHIDLTSSKTTTGLPE